MLCVVGMMLGSATAQTPRDTDASNAPITILVVGDSLAAEYGLARGSGWVALLETELRAEFPQLAWRNASISGDTTRGGLTRLPQALMQTRPHVVVLELGANDALRGLALAATRENLARMIRLSQEAGARVVLVGMQIPPNYGRPYAQAFAALFADLAKAHGTALVPFLLEGMATERSLFQADGIHPNEAAQALLAQNVERELRPLLEDLTQDTHGAHNSRASTQEHRARKHTQHNGHAARR